MMAHSLLLNPLYLGNVILKAAFIRASRVKGFKCPLCTLMLCQALTLSHYLEKHKENISIYLEMVCS